MRPRAISQSRGTRALMRRRAIGLLSSTMMKQPQQIGSVIYSHRRKARMRFLARRLRNMVRMPRLGWKRTMCIPTSPKNTRWVLQRKYRMGQSYASAATSAAARAKLGVLALGKIVVCALAGLATIWSEEKRMFWLMRGAMHVGVISGCLSLKQPEIYGHG